jgi:hypothetical protein
MAYGTLQPHFEARSQEPQMRSSLNRHLHTALLVILSAASGIAGCSFIFWILVNGDLHVPKPANPDEAWWGNVLLAAAGTVLGLIAGLPAALIARRVGPPDVNKALSGCCAVAFGLATTAAAGGARWKAGQCLATLAKQFGAMTRICFTSISMPKTGYVAITNKRCSGAGAWS